MKKLFIAIALAGSVIAAQAATNQLGSIKANAYVVTSEDDPTVAEWARTNHPPPIADLRSATNYTDTVAANMPLNFTMTNGVIDLAALVATNREPEFTAWQYATIPEGWSVSLEPSFDGESWAMLISNGDDEVWYRSYGGEQFYWFVSHTMEVNEPCATITATRRRNPIHNLGLVATNDLASAIRDATNDLALASTVNQWENYWRGDRVRLSVTNYYGNSSGEPPRLRIEESQTNAMGVVTNWVQVWDEVTRQTNYYNRVNADLAAISNNVMTASFIQTYNQLATKAPRAWGELTSSGEDAPPNTVWHTAPRSVFAGGTEYAHVAVGEGSICVLVDKGAPVYTAGAEGQFRFTDDSGANFFGFDVRSSYTLGCRTDGIAVSNGIVILSYDLTSASPPEILQCTNLTDGVWNTVQATWEQNPPAGMQICYMPTNGVCGFYKAQLSYAGGAKFLTNMQADLQGGIAASNETSDVIQSVYPVIVNGTVQWRVKQ